MVIVQETSLLNTYYYLNPFEAPCNLDTPYRTIHPNAFKDMTKVSPNPRTIYSTDFYLYNVKCIPIKHHKFTPLHQVLLVQDDNMIDTLFTDSLENWLDKYMYAPFMITNPCYKIQSYSKRFFFSNKYACSLSIFGKENYLFGAIANDGYSIGNGLIIALSMVSLGVWKEKDLLNYLQTNPVKCDQQIWSNYTLINSSYIMNNPFIYAHQFNSNKVYTYLYEKCDAVPIICHMSPYYTDVYITSTSIDIRTEHQYTFMNNCLDVISFYTKLTKIFEDVVYIQINFTQIIKGILDNKQLYSMFMRDDILLKNIKKLIDLNKYDASRIIVETFILLEKVYPQKKFYNVYTRFSKAFPDQLINELYRCLVHIRLGDMELPLPSNKFMRKTLLHNPAFKYFEEFSFTTYTYSNKRVPFEYNVVGTRIKYISMYNASWKKLLKSLKYKDFASKIMYKKLLLLKRKIPSHLVYFLITDYLERNPNMLL